jgi:flagellar hook-basal body complex protein FliE
MSMIIEQFGTLTMNRTDPRHFGTKKIEGIGINVEKSRPISPVSGLDSKTKAVSSVNETEKSFKSFLMEAVESVNSEQLNVSKLQEKLITDPDSVDVHDVTIAMSKARMSLNLAQTVIDRLVTGWNEITTTR